MLTLVRHGQTAANAQGLLQGRVDNPLDDVGTAQAAAVAASLPTVDAVVSSPLLRARQTAAAIADRHGASVSVDERFIELDYGEFDGTPLRDVPASVWSQWLVDPDFAPPRGERLVDLRDRVWAGLAELQKTASESHVVMVSHVSPMKSAVAWALGVPDEISWRMQLGTAAVCRVEFRGERPVLASFNDRSHLDGL